MSYDDLSDEDCEALAIYAEALKKAKTDEEREQIREAARETIDPKRLGNVICLGCLMPFGKCWCAQ